MGKKTGIVARTKHGPFVALLVLGCNNGIDKSWDGGRLQANVALEKCPATSASVPPPTPRAPRAVRGECREYSAAEFTILTRFHVAETFEGKSPPGTRDEIWRISCFQNSCDAAVLDGAALDADGALERSQLQARRGKVLGRNGKIVTVKFEGVVDEFVTADLSGGPTTYRQRFPSGAIGEGHGRCVVPTGAP